MQDNKPRAVGPPSLFHIVLAAFFALLVAQLSTDILPRLGSESWPTTIGTVTGTRVSISPAEDGTSYQPMVTYEYTVGGQSFTGVASRQDFASYPRQLPAEQLLQSYPNGRSVFVHYSAVEPSLSVLVPGVRGFTFFRIVALVGLVIVASLLWSLLRWLIDRVRFAVCEPE